MIESASEKPSPRKRFMQMICRIARLGFKTYDPRIDKIMKRLRGIKEEGPKIDAIQGAVVPIDNDALRAKVVGNKDADSVVANAEVFPNFALYRLMLSVCLQHSWEEADPSAADYSDFTNCVEQNLEGMQEPNYISAMVAEFISRFQNGRFAETLALPDFTAMLSGGKIDMFQMMAVSKCDTVGSEVNEAMNKEDETPAHDLIHGVFAGTQQIFAYIEVALGKIAALPAEERSVDTLRQVLNTDRLIALFATWAAANPLSITLMEQALGLGFSRKDVPNKTFINRHQYQLDDFDLVRGDDDACLVMKEDVMVATERAYRATTDRVMWQTGAFISLKTKCPAVNAHHTIESEEDGEEEKTEVLIADFVRLILTIVEEVVVKRIEKGELDWEQFKMAA